MSGAEPPAKRGEQEGLRADLYNPRLRKILTSASALAERNGDSYIGSEHVLLALAEQGSGTAWSVLDRLRVVEAIKDDLRTVLAVAAKERSQPANN